VYPPLDQFDFDVMIAQARRAATFEFRCLIENCDHVGFKQVGHCVNHMLRANKKHPSNGAVQLAEAKDVPDYLKNVLKDRGTELKVKVEKTKEWLIGLRDSSLGDGMNDMVAVESSDDEEE